eukprot:6570118-Pyramimonas_sp.AAC.1
MVLERHVNFWRSVCQEKDRTIAYGVHFDTEMRRHEDLRAILDKAKAAFFRDTINPDQFLSNGKGSTIDRDTVQALHSFEGFCLARM